MQSIYGFVLLWVGASVALVVLIRLTNVVAAQEEEPEDEAADEPVMPKYDFYWVRMDSASDPPLDQQIEALKIEALKLDGSKKCQNVNDGITEEHFPSQQVGFSGKIKVFLIPLNKEVREIGVFKHMDELGLCPGHIKELLALGKVFKETHLKTVLAAFGSVWEQSSERRLVPYFEFNGATFGLYMDTDKKILANEKDENWYAIAVYKKP